MTLDELDEVLRERHAAMHIGHGPDGRADVNEGVHTAEEVLAAGREHFPHVFENLKKAGVELAEAK